MIVNNAGGGYCKTLGGWCKDDAVRYDSSSGGVFSILANAILEQEGIVYGCALNDRLQAVHIGIERKEELWKLRGSKYIQSEIGDAYKEIREILDSGRKVMFVGTPCQVAGLDSFLLGKTYDNLYKVDFICHGVPSPKIFEAYIENLENKYNSNIISFRFRNKDNGWNASIQLGTEIKFANGLKIRKYPAYKDSFMNGFSDDLYLRPSCYNCVFKGLQKKYTDFTIADFWGVNKVAKHLYDGKGTSLVLVHNERADLLWNQVKEDFYFEFIHLENAICRNPSLISSAKENPNRKSFFEDFERKGYSYVERKYLSAHIWFIHKVIMVVKKQCQKILKN